MTNDKKPRELATTNSCWPYEKELHAALEAAQKETAELKEKLEVENLRMKWQLKQFKTHGTTDCENNNDGYMSKGCHGRVTLFIANTKCLGCDPDGYEIPSHETLAKIKGE